MNIQPTRPNPTPPHGARQPDQSAASLPVRPDGHPAAGPREIPSDQVEISQAARDLDKQAPAGREADPQLPVATLRVLLGRAVSGFYDQPEIRDAVLSRLASDLESLPEG